MSVVGEAALTAFFDGLFGKFSSSEFLNFVTEKQVRKELNKWEKMLRDIRAVLDDAEEKQMKDQHVKNWLADLQDLAYDVDDILDEFATETLGRKLKISEESQVIRSKVQKISTLFSPGAFMFNAKMMRKIKRITVRIDDLATKRTQLELREFKEGTARSNRMKQRLPPTSLVDETHVYGRQKEKAAILELLLSNDSGDEGVSVIPIIGMGGIGKTTLAQLVYNDNGIKTSFDHTAWVCVSEDFDAIAITKTILQSITSDCCTDINDLNLLQVKLKEELAGKKFLLVLDDIWNENYEDLTVLLSPFGVGTKILVTTRSHNVSSIMGTVETNPLQQLSGEDSLSIFTQHALKASDFSGHPELKEAGENIVKKCNGLPLAAKAIGGLLRTSVDPEVWEEVLKSEIWDIPKDKCGVIPALRLSYHHLPPHLKRCFAYCSILPKDYEFEEEEIILLWKAEGFLQQASRTTQIEGLGSQFFRDLVLRSFFQTSDRSKTRFMMHDLVNDLAQSVAGDICSKLEDNKQLKISKRTRHSSYVRGTLDGMKKFEAFDQTKHLRTFLSLLGPGSSGDHCFLSNNVLIDLLPKLRYLRVLSLRGYHIIELPDFFQKLRHLRYLDFSCTAIKSLPDSICTLYNLETLLLLECDKLEKLPSNLGSLVNLQLLDITGAISLKGMPFGIDKLTSLRKLSNFALGKGDGHRIQEMKNLSFLKGKLSISGLENIVEAQNAREAMLIDKLGLDILTLKWSKDFGDNRNEVVEEQVLSMLEPQQRLKELLIQNYGGTKFPNWMNFSLQNLSSLVLSNCKNCVSLPSVGKLPLLKNLSIDGMDELNKVGIEFYGENESNAFASLQSLCFRDMPRWREWDLVVEQALKFPSLVDLSIINCPQLLGTLPNPLHSLKKLAISGCTQLVVSLSDFPVLTELKIFGCAELVLGDYADFPSLETVSLSKILKFCIPTERLGLLGHLRSVGNLNIMNCPQLVSLQSEEVEEEDQFQLGERCNVEFLTIMNCERLRRLPEVLHCFKFLMEMRIEGCRSIVSFSKSNFPPALKKMMISRCVKLQCLVDEGESISVIDTSPLEHLTITGCPSLIGLSLPTRLQYLQVWYCSKLVSLSSSGELPKGLRQLNILKCSQLESMAQSIQENACLEVIEMRDCENIKSLPRGLDKLNHLQKIAIDGCPNLIFFTESGLPTTNLRDLRISRCEKFRALPDCMNNLISLQNFTIKECPNVVAFPENGFPTTNLTDLEIERCERFRALPNGMHYLTSLQRLVLHKCSAEISFPEEGLPTNLKVLSISGRKICRSLFEWGLHRLASLREASIYGEGCFAVVSFPQEELGMMLPPSLRKIRIADFENLKWLSSKGFQNLAFLQDLSLINCPKLTSLPEKDVLLSLSTLYVRRCPLLKEGCKRDKGREWSKIAHMPYVEFRD